MFKIAAKWERIKLRKLNEITYIENLNIIMAKKSRSILISGLIDITSDNDGVNS